MTASSFHQIDHVISQVERVLVLSPHPDDEVLGCGGSLLLHARQQATIQVVFLTSGEAGDPILTATELAKTREAEARQAGKSFGALLPLFWRWPDGGLTYETDKVMQLTQLIRQFQPNVVYLPHHQEAHHDHQIGFELGWEAIQRAGGEAFRSAGPAWYTSVVLAYEVWTPLPIFQRTVDISEVMEVKLMALTQHASQLKNVSYDQAIQGLNRYRGAMTGRGKYVECFQIIRQ